jgi:hypothetical protein
MNNKRKLLVGVFVVLLLTAGVVLFVGTRAPICLTVTYDGEGTEANPYKISNIEQLQCIEEQGLDANYVQVSDIDASETSGWNDGEGFDPISKDTYNEGTWEYHYFNGTFDGNGYEITDLTIRELDNSGIFGTVGSSGKVTNVSVVVDVSNQGLWVQRVGGLAGVNRGTIENSYVSGSVGGEFRVGGLVGENKGGTIRESYATAVVESTYGGVGGLVGENKGGTIRESYATAVVESTHNTVGGLVGENKGGTIRESYATGDVRGGTTSSGVGGLVGWNYQEGKIESSYATGEVEGDEKVGGLIGVMKEGGTVNESYWDTETTGQPASAGGTGLNTSEIVGSAAKSNMTGFDFNNTWRTVPGGYPALRKGTTTPRER